ncbi:MAG: HypC/HybG/HupF family hydrogenase formation chaperone [Propionibacteriaceae bacterium]|jgi:hydrogenase expression/formation protein HypC|nr:HypC/HybG/HupF family hydrogenase formation chaperone [Propionibacteriaceae bacterium]
MCVAAPLPILDITAGPMPMGHVELNGVPFSCCFAYVPEAQVGDYVLVNNGFAIEIIDPISAAESLAVFAELGDQPIGGVLG